MTYHDLPGVNWSRLKLMRISPLHYQANQFEDSRVMRIGRATHTLVLEPENWDQRYAVWKGDRRSSAYKEFAAAETREIVTTAEKDVAESCADAVNSNPLARHVLHGGVREQAITWDDEETGYPCKGRPDYAGSRVVDLKVTNPRSFGKRFGYHAADLGYHGQIAFYHDGLIATGHTITRDPALVVVEDKPPHDVAVYRVGEYEVDAGRREYRRLLRRLIHCETTNEWPGVGGGDFLPLDLPNRAYDFSEEI